MYKESNKNQLDNRLFKIFKKKTFNSNNSAANYNVNYSSKEVILE